MAGPLAPLFAIRDAARNAPQYVADVARSLVEPIQLETLRFLNDPRAYTLERLKQGRDWGWQRWEAAQATLRAKPWEKAWQNFRENPLLHTIEAVDQANQAWQKTRGTISLALDFVPVVGDVKNCVEGLFGTDLAGNKLSQAERTLMIAGAGVGAFTILDEIADAASLARHAANDIDLAGDALRASKGLGHLDASRAGDIARAIRHADDLAISRRLRNLDEFTGGRRTADEAAQVRNRLTRNTDEGALSRRLDDTASLRRSEGVGGNCAFNSFTAGTPIHTDEGQKPIEEIEVGDKILAEDPETSHTKRGYFEGVVCRFANHCFNETWLSPERRPANNPLTLESSSNSGQ
jgi:hypothetical protein